MALNVLLVGAESAAIQVLRGLAEADHRVVGVLADEEPRAGGLAATADALGLPSLEMTRLRDPDFAGWLVEQEVDLLLNVHSLTLLGADVLGAPRIGSFNLHPGPLPAYAGLNVVNWAIYRGETTHAVTLHWMDAGVDTGLIVSRAEFPITTSDTGLSVFAACVRLGVPLIFDLLEVADRDPAGIAAEPQVGERRVYRRDDRPQGGWIDWALGAGRVHDFVRACDFGPFPSPWGHPLTGLDEVAVGLVGSALTGDSCRGVAPGTVGEAAERGMLVATGDEWLSVRAVVTDGRPQPAATVLQPGTQLRSHG
jgi:UDP-4-amino-4-deoxy-L-arabinose formyltransferase/UDP-glucuronic acid dehydrogenase (UDP-4-keto-hexauronic acid decarboxylating)